MASDLNIKEVEEENESPSLSSIYENGMKLYSEIENNDEPTNSKTVQKVVADAITSFEKATKMVSCVGLFSINESLDEVPSSDIKYLQLPSLLGDLTQKQMNGDRLDLLKISQAYYKDFLMWCKCYKLINSDDCEKDNSEDDEEESSSAPAGVSKSLLKQSMTREAKLRHYKEQRELDKDLEALKIKVDSKDASEEIQRNYYKKLLQRRILHCQEELENIEREINILKLMPPRNENGKLPDRPIVEVEPLKPILIVKDAMQKHVFGLGYPSAPTMSIEEFYEQKLKKNFGPQPPDTFSLMQKALAGMDRANDLEREVIEKEEAEERDDADALQYARDFDDWKDVNRRGCGNRKNMG